MKLTEEQINEIKNDPLTRFTASILGMEVDDIVERVVRKYEEEHSKKEECKKSCEKKPYEAPKCEVRNFLMTREQFRQFCLNYNELISIVKKLDYVYGISLNTQSGGKTLSELVRTIIWDFVRIIFGDENADDIADFLYGNSHFDSPEKLYDELV